MFPLDAETAQVDNIVLGLFEKARKAKISVTRAVMQAFGRSATATLLEASTSGEKLKKLETFQAGDKWAKNFVKRQNLVTKVLHGEAGSVNPNSEVIKKGMETVIHACKEYPPSRIFNVDETGIFWKLMPKRSYLSASENVKTVRGTKGMHFKDRVSAFMCATLTVLQRWIWRS